MTHILGPELLQVLRLPTLVAYSREDRAVPFSHAEWAIQHISGSVLCESGFTGYLYRIGPDYRRISRALVEFLIED